MSKISMLAIGVWISPFRTHNNRDIRKQRDTIYEENFCKV